MKASLKNTDDIFYFELGGRMGLNGCLVYAVEKGELTSRRTNSSEDEAKDKVLREMLAEIEEEFEVRRLGGFGNAAWVRKGLDFRVDNQKEVFLISWRGQTFEVRPSNRGFYFKEEYQEGLK